MKSFIIIAFISLAVSAKAMNSMSAMNTVNTINNSILLNPEVSNPSSSRPQSTQSPKVEKTTPVVCTSTSLTKEGLPIVLSKKTTTFKMNLPVGESYKVFTLLPNFLSLRNEESGYSALGKIQHNNNNEIYDQGEFSLEIRRLPGEGKLLLAFNSSKEVVPVTVICSRVDNR